MDVISVPWPFQLFMISINTDQKRWLPLRNFFDASILSTLAKLTVQQWGEGKQLWAGWARGDSGPPIFGRTVNSTSSMRGRFCPPFTNDPTKCFHLRASLYLKKKSCLITTLLAIFNFFWHQVCLWIESLIVIC